MKELHWESEQHKHFFLAALHKCGNTDAYHQALFYTLGSSPDTRANIGRLFDFQNDQICPEALNEGWQTGGTRRLCRLAFNLWNGYAEQGAEQLSSPYELFDCGFAPYMLEGIRLRYPEYCRELEPPHLKTPKAPKISER